MRISFEIRFIFESEYELDGLRFGIREYSVTIHIELFVFDIRLVFGLYSVFGSYSIRTF